MDVRPVIPRNRPSLHGHGPEESEALFSGLETPALVDQGYYRLLSDLCCLPSSQTQDVDGSTTIQVSCHCFCQNTVNQS